MEKNYRKIQFRGGQTIESAMLYLERFKQHGELAYGEFNGHKLYSDIDDLDSAYKKITGRTKAEFDSERKREHLEYEEEQRKHKEAIPELTKEWIEQARLSAFGEGKNLFHFNKSLEIAIKHINACC